jgi:hypothetical protein
MSLQSDPQAAAGCCERGFWPHRQGGVGNIDSDGLGPYLMPRIHVLYRIKSSSYI